MPKSRIQDAAFEEVGKPEEERRGQREVDGDRECET